MALPAGSGFRTSCTTHGSNLAVSRAFNRIRNTELISARELFYAHCQIVAETEIFGGKSLVRRVLELFTVPRIRRAIVSSSVIVISQQFSGKLAGPRELYDLS